MVAGQWEGPGALVVTHLTRDHPILTVCLSSAKHSPVSTGRSRQRTELGHGWSFCRLCLSWSSGLQGRTGTMISTTRASGQQRADRGTSQPPQWPEPTSPNKSLCESTSILLALFLWRALTNTWRVGRGGGRVLEVQGGAGESGPLLAPRQEDRPHERPRGGERAVVPWGASQAWAGPGR